MVSTAKVTNDIEGIQNNLPVQNDLGPEDVDPGDDDQDEGSERVEDDEHTVQGLSQVQIQVLAQKIYDLLLDEIRIEEERYGRTGLR
jgi:hypothetical protein